MLTHRHPYYEVMDFSKSQLETILQQWSRLEIIDWLCWNDANGIYKDSDSIKEFGNIMSKEEGVAIMIKQIVQE
jgi:hypothetical protein